MQEIVMVMLLDILRRIADDNRSLIDSYVSSVILLYVIGGVIITLFFLAIAVYSLLNTLRNFTYLRKAIFLIPFKRLSEDSNTRFLLKKFIEIWHIYLNWFFNIYFVYPLIFLILPWPHL